MTAPAVFIDACVLFPGLVRGIVLGAAERGLFRPYWSVRVLDEWQIAVARRHGGQAEALVQSARSAMLERFPEALVPAAPDLEAQLSLPDPADAHVAAAASGTDILLTFNLRDFPRRQMAGLNLNVRHPDSLLWELWSHSPAPVTAAVRDALNQIGADTRSPRNALKRARLPRLGKALADATDGSSR